MAIRDVLQMEIWSKETSRKILKVSSICFAIVVILGGIVFGVERYWITPHERNVARVALVEVDVLQQVSNTNKEGYKTRKDIAEAAVEKAEKAAWTWRDGKVAEVLDIYLTLIELEHQDRINDAMMRAYYKGHPERYRKDPQVQRIESQIEKRSQEFRELLGRSLHRVLD